MPCYTETAGTAVQEPRDPRRGFTVAVLGNPNSGKTSLFNGLTGLRAQTANYPGTTVEHKTGRITIAGHPVKLLDLPGMYSVSAVTPEERVALDVLTGTAPGHKKPDAAVVIVDATKLERNLFLASQILEQDIPVVVALNMIDLAEVDGITVDVEKLSNELGCPVVPTIARTGQGLDGLRDALKDLVEARDNPEAISFSRPAPVCDACASCPFQSRFSWTEDIASRCVTHPTRARSQLTEKIDTFLTHPVAGFGAFMMVMLSVFYLIFSVASIPMELIDGLFAHAGAVMERLLPAGDLRSLVVDGIIGGVGGILVFLPQICILFFFLALLEDSGYLARAAFVMDRLMRRVGLPGTAFVPLVSAHACALPAIMAARVIKDPRDRLVTILVAPLMTCSARIPVYAMITALLFPDHPWKAALVFTGAYGLGVVAALGMAFVFKRTILPGESKPLVLELPTYRIPGLRTALLYTLDRARVFLSQAGTIILVISVILWALATYPKSEPPVEAVRLAEQAEQFAAAGQAGAAAGLVAEAARLTSRSSLEHSAAGRLGKLIEPVVRPLGFDWQIGIGIVSSFAAREVIVSTLAIVYGIGEEAVEEEPTSLYDTLRTATRSDGTRVFTTATCISLLVFYVLAMQCLPTQAVTKRETGSWKWAFFQLAYMTLLAYGASFVAFQAFRALGIS